MSPNKKQFVLMGIAAALFAAILLTGVIGSAVRGNYMAAPAVGLSLIFAFMLIWLGIWLNQRRIQLMFRRETPDRLIEHYQSTLLQARARKIPNADAAAAHLSALAAIVYGQYGRAREELDAVDWNQAPPAYRAHRLDVLALIALLEKHDAVAALRFANEAQSLVSKDRAATLPVLHGAIMVAIGEASPETLKRVQRAAGRNMGAIPALCAWALSLYCSRNGQPDEAATFRTRALEAAPHFAAFSKSA